MGRIHAVYGEMRGSTGVSLLKEAMLYEKAEDNKVHCFLCNHECIIAPLKRGFCGVRENREGKLYTHTYGEVIAANCDPVEKKPLYHFFPGTATFSIAAMGCNFRCGFCQNWEISQIAKKKELKSFGYQLTPDQIIRSALENECESISYTYTEPTIFFEYAFDIARLARKEGLRNIFVTNGYMSSAAAEKIAPYLDACNIDLKSFREEFYRDICSAHLEPVLKTIRRLHQRGIWIELTTLVVPHQNDAEDELSDIASFIAALDRSIPWHISRFYPDYQLNDVEVTPLESMRKAYAVGKEHGLRFVYLGNIPSEAHDTFCPRCDHIIIARNGYTARVMMKDSVCPNCGEQISGKFVAS